MAKAKKLGYKLMPKAVMYRVGCKVSWRYYRTEAEAKKASVVARHNAAIDASLGYDFGYCSPGSIRYMDPAGHCWEGTAGLWEVCES